MATRGQGLLSARSAGGLSSSSKLTTLVAAVTDGRADAVGACVAAADDDHVQVSGRPQIVVDRACADCWSPAIRLFVLPGEEIHSEMDALEVTPWGATGRVERLRRTRAQQHGIEFID